MDVRDNVLNKCVYINVLQITSKFAELLNNRSALFIGVELAISDR